MKTLEFTCVSCPVGCSLTVQTGGGEIKVSGNRCKRGEAYGKSEAVNPVRTLTTTVYVKEISKMLPVRSDAPVSKARLKEFVKIIKNAKIHLPISVGDVIIENIDGNGNNIISASDCKI